LVLGVEVDVHHASVRAKLAGVLLRDLLEEILQVERCVGVVAKRAVLGVCTEGELLEAQKVRERQTTIKNEGKKERERTKERKKERKNEGKKERKLRIP
jgi:hypothetical protein